MALDRPIQKAQETVETVSETIKSKLSILDDRKRCDDCNGVCEPTQDFVRNQALIMPVWECQDCGQQYHREAESPVSTDPWNR